METKMFRSTCTVPNDFINMEPLPETFWIPPEGGRFFCLTREDECWARPLGLGKVVTLFEFAKHLSDKLREMTIRSLNIPSNLFQVDDSTFNDHRPFSLTYSLQPPYPSFNPSFVKWKGV